MAVHRSTPDNASSIGITIRLLRVSVPLSAPQLAELVGLPTAAIDAIESGLMVLDAVHARRIAHALDIPTELLVPSLRLAHAAAASDVVPVVEQARRLAR